MPDDQWIPIYYSGFWDVPMAFLTKFHDDLFFFSRGYFDDDLDDYPPTYKIYRVLNTSIDESIEPFEEFPDLISIKNVSLLEENELVGEVLVKNVIFDDSHRKFVNTSVFEVIGSAGKSDKT